MRVHGPQHVQDYVHNDELYISPLIASGSIQILYNGAEVGYIFPPWVSADVTDCDLPGEGLATLDPA